MNIQIAPAELAGKLGSENPPHLLDVRETEENAFVALPNSTLIPLGELASRVGEIDGWRDQEVVVYCHHGIRSLNAIAQLKHFGFTKVQNLAGGIDRWTSEVNPELPRY